MSSSGNKGSNVESIVNMIFANSPKPPCTYKIELSNELIMQNVSLFQLLMSILVSGAKKLYGEQIVPNQISEKQFSVLKSYMASMGYIIKHNYSYPEQQILDSNSIRATVINIWFEQYISPTDCHGRVVFL